MDTRATAARRHIPRSIVAAVAAAAVLASGALGCSSPSPIREIAGPGRGAVAPLRFVDVAGDVGLDTEHRAFQWGVSADPVAMMGGGLCWLDYDDDGWMDLYVVDSWSLEERARWLDEGGLPTNGLFHNEQGHFVDVSAGSGADLSVRGSGCVAADFDLDGRTDLYVTTDAGGALLWNEGDGAFEEGAAEAGAAAAGWTTGAAVGDVNGDSWPDLFVAGYANLNSDVEGATLGFPNTQTGVRDLLFLNEGRDDAGHVTFREVGAEAGLEVVAFEYGLGAVFSDFDDDGDADLYVANDTKPNRLYSNVAWPGGPAADPEGLGFRFDELAARAGAADPNAGMGVTRGDLDANGRTDLVVTNARGQAHAAYLGQEPTTVDPSFLDVRAEVGVDLGARTGWGVSFADLDLDTDLDLVIANGAIPVTDLETDAEPLQVLLNTGVEGASVRLDDVSASVGVDAIGPLVGRATAAADFDNDGDLDVAVSSVGGPLVLLENRAGGGHWLEVALDGFHPGAVVTVELPDGTTLEREVAAGSGYLSSEDPRLHFGLGDATDVTEMVVRWPDGETTRVAGPAADSIIEVRDP